MNVGLYLNFRKVLPQAVSSQHFSKVSMHVSSFQKGDGQSHMLFFPTPLNIAANGFSNGFHFVVEFHKYYTEHCD